VSYRRTRDLFFLAKDRRLVVFIAKNMYGSWVIADYMNWIISSTSRARRIVEGTLPAKRIHVRQVEHVGIN
jgi:hypothetical protein